MKINLDLQAMLALFPPGSQAEIELKTAVIAETAKRITRTIIDKEIEPIVRSRAQEIAKEIRQQMGMKYIETSWGSSRVELTPSHKEAIKAEVEQANRDLIRSELNSKSSEVTKVVEPIVNEYIRYFVRTAVKAEIDRQLEQCSGLIKDRVKAEFEKILQK